MPSFPCPYCPEVYLRNDRLRDHVRRVHPGQNLPPPLRRPSVKKRGKIDGVETLQAKTVVYKFCSPPCPGYTKACLGNDLGEHIKKSNLLFKPHLKDKVSTDGTENGQAPTSCHKSLSHPCPYCPEVYLGNDYLSKHLSMVHQVSTSDVETSVCHKVSSFGCLYCSEVCLSNDSLKEHVSKIHKDTKLPLPLNSASAVDAGKAVNTHNKMCSFACPYCPEVYLRNDRLRDHVRRVHLGQKLPPLLKKQGTIRSEETEQATTVSNEISSIPCPYCPEMCLSNDHLGKHVSKTHQGKKLPLPPAKQTAEEAMDSIRRSNSIAEIEQAGRACHKLPSFPCPHCPKVLTGNNRLRQHIKMIHPGEKLPPPLRQPRVKKQGSTGGTVAIRQTVSDRWGLYFFLCPYCPEVCLGNDYLVEHVSSSHPGQKLPLPHKKRITEDRIAGNTDGVECTEGNKVSPNNELMSEFSETGTSRQANSERMSTIMKNTHWLTKKFNSFEEFEAWKTHEEDATKTRFVKYRGDQKRFRYTYRLYNCHRSGCCRETKNRKRHMKSTGSAKIGRTCPAVMMLKIFEAGDCILSYRSNHEGHTFDIDHLHLRKSQRKSIASLLSAGIPIDDILTRLKTGASSASCGYRITRKDLGNIAREFRLREKNTPHADDEACVAAWIESMERDEGVFDPDIDCVTVEVDAQSTPTNQSDATLRNFCRPSRRTVDDYLKDLDDISASIRESITDITMAKIAVDGFQQIKSVLSTQSVSCNIPSLLSKRGASNKRTTQRLIATGDGRSIKAQRRGKAPAKRAVSADKDILMHLLADDIEVAPKLVCGRIDHNYACATDRT